MSSLPETAELGPPANQRAINLDWNAVQHLSEADWGILCAFLQNALLGSSEVETAVGALRAELLELIAGGLVDRPRLLNLLSALAIFCRDSEFVIPVSAKEAELLAGLSLGRRIAEDLIIRCYRAVDEEEFPIDEIERLSPIADDTSLAVQAMYEENPYPRWKELPVLPTTTEAIDCLIAGCGSGRHILATAAASPHGRFVGVDLSRASLAYGLMKAKEHGISNVRLVHGDILKIAEIGITFNHISAVGSVHHMRDPLSGVKALAGVLKPGGSIKLALYSKFGRTAQLAGIELRQNLDIPATREGIQKLRQAIYSLPDDHPARGVIKFSDFYSFSGCRDMLFHVQEHNYTVPEIFDLIDASGLRLESFRMRGEGKDVAQTREGLTNLERTHPGFAGAMFRFTLIN